MQLIVLKKGAVVTLRIAVMFLNVTVLQAISTIGASITQGISLSLSLSLCVRVCVYVSLSFSLSLDFFSLAIYGR